MSKNMKYQQDMMHTKMENQNNSNNSNSMNIDPNNINEQYANHMSNISQQQPIPAQQQNIPYQQDVTINPSFNGSPNDNTFKMPNMYGYSIARRANSSLENIRNNNEMNDFNERQMKGRSTSLRVRKNTTPNQNGGRNSSLNNRNVAEALDKNSNVNIRRTTSLNASGIQQVHDEPVSAAVPLQQPPKSQQQRIPQTQEQTPNALNLQYNIMPFPLRKYLADMAKCKIFEMVECANVPVERILDQSYWDAIADKWFTPVATINVSKNSHNTVRHFVYIQRMFSALCQSARYLDIVKFELYPNQIFTQLLSNGTIFFSCLRLSFTYHYKDGSYVTHYSQFKGVFNTEFKIEWMDFGVHSFVPGIEWNALERKISNSNLDIDLSAASTPNDPYNSQFHATATNGRGTSEGEVRQKFATISKLRSNFDIFRNISSLGVHNDIVRALQINEIMSDLRFVRIYQRMHNISSPLTALQNFVDEKAQDIKAYQATINENMARVRSQNHIPNTNAQAPYTQNNNMTQGNIPNDHGINTNSNNINNKNNHSNNGNMGFQQSPQNHPPGMNNQQNQFSYPMNNHPTI